MLTKKEVKRLEQPKIFLSEKIIIGVIVTWILQLIIFPTIIIGDNFGGLDLIGKITFLINLFLLIVLLIIIFKRFSDKTKAKISFIVGIIVIINVLDFFLNLFKIDLSYAVMIMSILGVAYGFIGVKSPDKSFSIFGILLNIPGLYLFIKFLIYLIGSILFFVAVSTHGFAP